MTAPHINLIKLSNKAESLQPMHSSSLPVLLGSETWESVILQSQVVAQPAVVTILDVPWQNPPAMKQSLEKDWVLVPRHVP